MKRSITNTLLTVFLLSVIFCGSLQAQDYTITTTGNALVITDNTNSDETIDVSESGANIRFVVTPTTKTYSINGGATTAFTTPADVALSGLTSITLNMAGGNDSLNVATFTANLPSLTINGGIGNDAVRMNGNITFATNANFDLDLQNDNASPGTDSLTVASNVQLRLLGTGTATVKVSRNIFLNTGARIETANGNLILEANQQATSTTGNFQGVYVKAGGTIMSGTGTVSVIGKGGTDSFNHGVNIEGASTVLTSSGGNVSVTGTAVGAAATTFNWGVAVTFGATISAGGSGTVTVVGNASTIPTGSSNHGVRVEGASSSITSSGGNVSVTGTGGGAGASNINAGVYVIGGARISAGGGGTVTVVGYSSATVTGGNSYGIYLRDATSIITSSGGNVSVTGTGGGTGVSGANYGLYMRDGATISAGSSGTVTVVGNGSTSSTGIANHGVHLISSATITSSGGNVSVTGSAGGSDASSGCIGISLQSASTISAGGLGNVTILGNGGSGSANTNYGVSIAANLTSSGGNVNLTATEGINSIGLVITPTGSISTATNGGNITLNTKSMSIGGAVTSANAANITLRTPDNIAINLGASILSDPLGGPLSIADAELYFVTGGTIIIGHALAGDITVSAGISRTAATNMQLVTAGDVLISGGSINTNGGTLLLDAGNTPKTVKPTFTGTDVTCSTLSFGSNLAIVINGTTPNTDYDQLNVVGAVNLTGVGLILSGTPVPALTEGAFFTIVNNDGSDAIIGTFTGLAEGATLTNFLGSGLNATISYIGGSGNDVVIFIPIDVSGPPHYTITTTGNALVITDNLNNSETIDVSENGTNILLLVTTPIIRTYTLNGGATTAFTTPVNIPISGLTSMTINAAGGNDIINVAAFMANLPSLTINGGTGNDGVNINGDITFATNANLNLDLQNDDANPGTDSLVVATNANLILSGTGTATVKVSRSITINAGASIETVNGNLLAEANQQATPTTGAFYGVTISGTDSKLISTGSGTVTVKGKGGDNGSSPIHGVAVLAGGNIKGGTGAVSVTGRSSNSTATNNIGVLINGASSAITSTDSNVSVTGTGDGTGASANNVGVAVRTSAKISAGGSGAVTILGNNTAVTTGGGNIGVLVRLGATITTEVGGTGTVTVTGNGSTAATGTGNNGVYVFDVSSAITSSGGNVSVTGTSGGTGTSQFNLGVTVQTGGTITAGGTGTVTIVGNGSAATEGSFNYGVHIAGTDATITSSGGNVSVTGTSGGTTGSRDNYGVNVQSAGKITAGATGTVTVVGNGSPTATGNSNYGVRLDGTSSTITSSGGNVSVTGTGGGTGASSGSNHGVSVQLAATITATGSGTVTVVGNGSTNTTGSLNYGVSVSSASSSITSSGGNVSVTGTGGGTGASSSNNYGVSVSSSGTITAGGMGTVTVVGNGSTTATNISNYGVYVFGASATITSSGGNVSVTGTGGTEAGNGNVGVFVTSMGTITAGGMGTVTVNGVGGSGSGNPNYGIQLDATITSSGGNVNVMGTGNANSVSMFISANGIVNTATNGGNIILNAKSLLINAAATISANAASSVTLRAPDNIAINLGTSLDPPNGPLGLSNSELDRVTAGTIIIGHAQAGTISISADILRTAATNMQLVTAGDVEISGGGINTNGGTLLLDPGVLPTAVKPTYSGTDVTCSTLSFGSDLAIVINGTTVNTTYNQLDVVGAVNLTGVRLVLSGTPMPPLTVGAGFTIVNNDGTDAIIGTFTGLAQGATISNFLGTGATAMISYTGGTGNDVVLTVSAVLPVELLTFNGKNIEVRNPATGGTEGGNLLTWTTAEEKNSRDFDIERSNDGHHFIKIGSTKAKGSNSTYEFTDNTPLSNLSFYRLKINDLDGKTDYSKTISIQSKGKSMLKIYPSVTSQFLTVETNEVTDYQVFSLLGQQVLNGKTAQQIDVSRLSQGTYVLKVGTEVAKFVKQ